jgi:tRNA A37 threonylcarbamoyladenosine biosynthesis protein TsaE
MISTFYLPRNILSDNKTISEMGLLAASNYVVILAEPGGGKTELMRSLAQQLRTTAVTANKFVYLASNEKNTPLVIDAFDELSKVDASGISKLLSKAKETNPTHVYLASRSSEWDEAATHAFKEILGHEPLVVRLCSFDEGEQRAIFNGCNLKFRHRICQF